MRDGIDYLRSIADRKVRGIPSLCSANETVLRAALEYARDCSEYLLIECTANQVNQFGGYTGMTPAMFLERVQMLARETGFDSNRLILGGDHLGPLVFRHFEEKEAMDKACDLIDAYVAAGFQKIHLDTSMRLKNDSLELPLRDEVIARRAAMLCTTAEETARSNKMGCVVYVIGSEVPTPGGEQAKSGTMHVTSAQDFENTFSAFHMAFADVGLEDAFSRIVAAVVQPGVEFGDDIVFEYDDSRAKSLTSQLARYPGIVFEGHSTDYQSGDALRAMVRDGIGILKVGPELTFAMREALFALQYILEQTGMALNFIETLDAVMREKPEEWNKYFQGTESELQEKRKFSYADRWRYYAGDTRVLESMRGLMERFDAADVPDSLLHQFLPLQYEKIRNGSLEKKSAAFVMEHIKTVIDKYYRSVK